MSSRRLSRHAARWLGVIGVAGAVALAGCGPGATGAPSPSPTATSRPTISLASPSPAPTPVLTATPPPSAPAGTVQVAIPEARILLPVPSSWRRTGAADLADPAVRADLAATYPGAGDLLVAIGQLGDRAAPAFLAVNPSAASLAGPVAANISVLVSQPSVGGFLLDFVAGMISAAIGGVLHASGEPAREHIRLPIGEAVRFRYDVSAAGSPPVTAVCWVIGAPGGTLLVTVMGTAAGLAGIDLDALANAIVPIVGGGG